MQTFEVTTSSRNDGNAVLPAAVLRNDQYHEFVLGQIVRPYQGMLGREKRIENMRYVPFGKNETTINYFELQNYALEEQYKKWFEAVLERLSRIYKQCDYSFFPKDDFFANTLKRRMIEVGIKDVSPYGSR
jgi:hypothetical protein